MWKAHYKDHIYIIFHGFVLPVHQAIFNKHAPRLSDEASIDLTSIGNWFGEEKFTYVRVFGNTTDPHVLPLHTVDKLLAREIAYQITEKGMSRNLKESKKQMWPAFPLHCGTYSQHDFKHAEKEEKKIKILKLAVIPKSQYDPNKVAYNFTTQVKLAKFDHEKYDYDDLFASAKSFSQEKHLAGIKLGTGGIDKFMQFRTQRLQTLPLDLLNTTPMVRQEVHSEEHITKKIPKKEQTNEKASELLDTNVHIVANLI